MIKNIQFENFKGFENMSLSDLKPITLISGKNNTGKSSILEGIFLFFDHISPDSFMTLNKIRGGIFSQYTVHLWEYLFYKLDTKNHLKISVTYNDTDAMLDYIRDDSYISTNSFNTTTESKNQFASHAKSKYSLKFHYCKNNYKENGHFTITENAILRNITTSLKNNDVEEMPSILMINPHVHSNDNIITEWVGKLELKGNKKKIVDILKYMDPMICDICTIAMDGQVLLYVRTNDNLIPLKLAGDGVNMLLYIVLAIIENPNSIILIDEIETGFHYSMYKNLWEVIAKAAHDYHCQIIATTHSYECIVGALDGMEETGLSKDFCYYRIDRNENGTNAYHFSDELLRTALSADMEVR